MRPGACFSGDNELAVCVASDNIRAHYLQGHALGMYNLAMMHLAKDSGGCGTALELLKKVAGASSAIFSNASAKVVR